MINLRDLPSVGKLLESPVATDLIAVYGRPLTLSALRDALDEIRRKKVSIEAIDPTSTEIIFNRAGDMLAIRTAPSLRGVINSTGVILHTNLGRAPYSKATSRAMDEISHVYSNLEYDLSQGERGSRLVHAENLLKSLTGAEAAIVVNNNASAVLLVLAALANRRKVIVSRTQLIEIGGGFRLPDIMKQSGAKLVEVGTTNRVHLNDYREALQGNAALVLHAHRSNFKLIGFTDEPELSELAAISREFDLPAVDDLGSGALINTEKYGLAHEPTVQESLKAGFDLVCFSGDKLLGGPQAGIIVGNSKLVEKLKRHPLARALRADKTRLAGLSATLLHYLKDEAEHEIPVWKMISEPLEKIRLRAEDWCRRLGSGEVIKGESTVGGGSLPGEMLPTYLLTIRTASPESFLEQLRGCQPPVIARTSQDVVLIDPRTVLPDQEDELLSNLTVTIAALP
ncbi:MAG: L-seryl-tRNA(Sec) selenium transferase [Chloroflexi bacterium RBG_16_51_16]|nr:MAG: L-seryl-tRNA(Sec) selenium transferase [Chloroflexi bacterium RBG_16_51_16]